MVGTKKTLINTKMVNQQTLKFCKRHGITPVYGSDDTLMGIDFSKPILLSKKAVDRLRRITKKEWNEQNK